MERKAVIIRAPNGDWYGAHVMDGSGSLREENVERRICRCASSRYRSGMDDIAPKSEAFRACLAVSLVVDSSLECIWRREECGIMTGLEFEDLQLKIAVK